MLSLLFIWKAHVVMFKEELFINVYSFSSDLYVLPFKCLLFVHCTIEFLCFWFCIGSIQKLRITSIGVELVDLKAGDLRWCLDFRDMSSPAIILLADTYGRKGGEHGGFVFCALYGRKSKAFQAAPGTSTSVIISNLVWMVYHKLLWM